MKLEQVKEENIGLSELTVTQQIKVEHDDLVSKNDINQFIPAPLTWDSIYARNEVFHESEMQQIEEMLSRSETVTEQKEEETLQLGEANIVTGTEMKTLGQKVRDSTQHLSVSHIILKNSLRSLLGGEEEHVHYPRR